MLDPDDMMSAEEYRALTKMTKGKGRRKYGNQPVTIDGIRFDSIAEGVRYEELKLMRDAGLIVDLETHPRFPLTRKATGRESAAYIADFAYTEVETGQRVVEDVKSVPTRKTALYRLKKKLIRERYGIEIQEIC